MTSPESSGSIPAARTVELQSGSCIGEGRTLNGFLNVIECSATDCAQHAQAFDRMRDSELQAVIVHKVYEQDLLREVVQRLERHDPGFLQTWFPEKFRSWFYGRIRDVAHLACRAAGDFRFAR